MNKLVKYSTIALIRRGLALLITAVVSTNAWSVGVGDIALQSKLGQPLQASLQLKDTGDLDTDQIQVRLAPADMFKKMGVERSYNLLSIKFEVTEQKTVRVTTHDPINEPFLNFIVEVHWPTGRIFREYKVFLDPV